MMPAALQLASRDSVPLPAPTFAADRRTEDTEPASGPKPEPKPEPKPATEAKPAAAARPVLEAQAAPAAPTPRPAPASAPDQPAGSVADRWGPMNQFAAPPPATPAPSPAPASAPMPSETAPAALATGSLERDADEVIEGSVPAIEGPAPLPRRRPVMTAQRRSADPPLPRPRPDGQVAPQSVFTAVPTTDDRYPGQQ
jgi:hypothetical protein